VLALELYNTLHASGDELADPRKWLATQELPATKGRDPSQDELRQLRETVRGALQAVVNSELPSRKLLDELNATAARAPASPAVRHHKGRLVSTTDYHGATRADVVLAAFAADALRLITSDIELKQCGAPGCVLLFVKDHPRRAWCSGSCGNRARQARHYARHRLDEPVAHLVRDRQAQRDHPA
jgi:predicted RNA-binding Zn ribbon-like protein